MHFASQLAAVLILSALLAGCDRLQEEITGEPGPEVQDAQAIGYACRVSRKTPEDCIADNETHRPSHILTGWQLADYEIHSQLLDPDMTNQPMQTAMGKKLEQEQTQEQPAAPDTSDQTEADPIETTQPE